MSANYSFNNYNNFAFSHYSYVLMNIMYRCISKLNSLSNKLGIYEIKIKIKLKRY